MRHGPASPPPARAPRVVVVDPDDAARACTAAMLAAAGCAIVATVNSHAQGMVAARTHRPDVIVTELRGGTILGPIAYLAALRGQCPTAAIVVYASVLPAVEDLTTAHAAAGLVKVVDAARLPGTVHTAHEARFQPGPARRHIRAPSATLQSWTRDTSRP